MKCGIGKYAFQMAKKLKENGDVINILSPIEGDGDFTNNLKGWFNFLKLIKYGLFYDKIVIQYHESFYYDDKKIKNLLSLISTNVSIIFIFLAMRRKIEVIIHEMPFNKSSKADYALERLKWRLCPKLIFHTRREVDKFESYYFKLASKKYELREPNAYFSKFKEIDYEDARKKLQLPIKPVIFLCIGFIQPHKGFDRTIRAFNTIENNKMQLYVVGSLRVNWGDNIVYLQNLRTLAEENSNVHLIEKYVSDEEFDMWIGASDVIIIPYREIWSSGVLGRAKLFKKPVIASNVGGLQDQLSEADLLFSNDEELEIIFRNFSKLL